MIDISGFGLKARFTATTTFPNGFDVVDFADDADPLDSPDFTAADTSMGLNGDMIVWTRPSGIEIAVSVIPTSPSDVNLDALIEANRVGKNKRSARDQIGVVFTYPSGMLVTMNPGAIVVGTIVPQVASAGRLKTRTYRFRFEQITKSNQGSSLA